MDALNAKVEEWIAQDCDAGAQEELRRLRASAGEGDEAARAQLEDRFRGPLMFGTAGLRGLVGAGETRMNRAVVRAATLGFCQWLLQHVEGAAERGLVVARDGRHMSPEFARDVAEVAAGAGLKVHFLTGTNPTPVGAFAVRHLKAAGGVVVTASHNPPAYNGYKVYTERGAQIVPPMDSQIAELIAAAPAANEIKTVDFDKAVSDGLVATLSLGDEYLAAIRKLSFDSTAPVEDLKIAYSAMHGVGAELVERALRSRGVESFHSVAEQAEPDGRFPTVDFPNPEEPGALDLVLELARNKDCDLVLVNDPDADRLSVSVKTPSGYQTLTGNEVGVLLADHLIETDGTGADRLFLATIVSSRLLSRLCAARGVRYAETLTGFKWIANEAMRLEDESEVRTVFGYEEALGYAVGTVVRDKDGISAALAMTERAARLAAQGKTLVDRLEELRGELGDYVGRQVSITLPGTEGRARIDNAMAKLRQGGLSVVEGARSVWDLKSQKRTTANDVSDEPRWSGNVLIWDLDEGGRVAARPSGTEPKLKLYLEARLNREPGESTADRAQRGRSRLDQLETQMRQRADLTPAAGA